MLLQSLLAPSMTLCATLPTATLLQLVEGLGSDIVPLRRGIRIEGPTAPRLIQVLLRPGGRPDIAERLRKGTRRDFKEAQRLLTVLLRGESRTPLVEDIENALEEGWLLSRSPTSRKRLSSTRERAPRQRTLYRYFLEGEKRPEATGDRNRSKKIPSPSQDTPFAISHQLELLGIRRDSTRVFLPREEPLVSGALDYISDPWRDDRFQSAQGFLDLSGGFPAAVTNRLGSKSTLLPSYEKFIPRVRFKTFVDVFGGSLSVLAYMVRTGRVGPETRIIVSEFHPQLFLVYRAIRDNVEELVAHLKLLGDERNRTCSQSLYDRLKAEYNSAVDHYDLSDPVWAAARYIYLLAACWRSVLRQNSRGHINVKYGGDGRLIFSEENLKMMHAVLERAILINGHFDQFMGYLDEDPTRTFVYMDPPYHTTETTTEYGVPAFRIDHQQAVAQIFFELRRKGIWAAVSNADTELIRHLYRMAPVMESFGVNEAMGEGQRKEVLALNYSLSAP